MADAARLTALPASGWYFGIRSTGIDVQGAGAAFNLIQDPQMWDASAVGRSLLLRLEFGNGGSASGGVWREHNTGLSFDFFTDVTAEGLARWLASEQDDIGPHPANAAGAQVAQYGEGDTTWRQAVDQLAYADRLCYAIDGQKLLRFWSADGPGAEPVAWPGGGGANMGAFLGRRIRVGDEAFLLTGASFDAMTGQVDFSSPGQPSATVAGARLGNVG